MPPAFAALGREAAAAPALPASNRTPACSTATSRARACPHQDRNERDFSAPIVSVSLGMPAVFLFGGLARSDPAARVPLFHGDVVVWGGADRLRFHGVLPLKDRPHPRLGSLRLNLTLRKAG